MCVCPTLFAIPFPEKISGIKCIHIFYRSSEGNISLYICDIPWEHWLGTLHHISVVEF